jgi:hypothetical protein
MVLVAVGATTAVAAWLSAGGRLPRNRIVGMRTSATLTTDEAWRAAFRASAWSPGGAAVVTLSCGVRLLVARPSDGVARGVTLVVMGVVVVVVFVGGVQANRVATRVERRHPPRRSVNSGCPGAGLAEPVADA